MLSALLVLLLSVVMGTIAHELAHAAALKSFGIPHTIRWFPDRETTSALRIGIRGQWAAVTHHTVHPDTAPWKLRIAAMMPFTLVIPAIGVYVLAAPGIDSNLHATMLMIGLLACAIPSPADFSIFWHPMQSIEKAVR